MVANALQHIHQVGVGGQVVQFAGADQALLGPQFCPAEQPIFLSPGYRAQGLLQVVGVWLYVRIFQEDH